MVIESSEPPGSFTVEGSTHTLTVVVTACTIGRMQSIVIVGIARPRPQFLEWLPDGGGPRAVPDVRLVASGHDGSVAA